jgi:broad specificity phosphatase PhoE
VARFRADPVAHPFPGAEPPADAAQRCAAALRRIAARHGDDTVLVVAHNTLLRLGLCVLLGLPVARYRQVFPRPDNVAVTEIALPDGGGTGPVALLSLNVPIPTQPITKKFHDTPSCS